MPQIDLFKSVAALAAQAGDAAAQAGSAAANAAAQAGSAAADAAGSIADKVKNGELTPEISFEDVITQASKAPGVHVERESYLRGAFSKWAPAEQVEEAVETSPALAGIDPELVSRLADDAITYERNIATATSAAAGLPGNVAIMVPATVADITQFYAHVLRVIQKLGYLYGWHDFLDFSGDEMDDASRNELILLLGVMSGVQSAEKAIYRLAQNAGNAAARRLARQALTKGAIYPVVKRVCFILGVQMNKKIFSSAVGKAIPLAGGAISGGLTFATFTPMAAKLKDYLATLPTANASWCVAAQDVEVDIPEDEENNGDSIV